MLRLSFAGYSAETALPSLLGLAIVWAVIARRYAGRWERELPAVAVTMPPHTAWQSGKGLVTIGALVAAFLYSDLPRDVLAMAAAGRLLTSRTMGSRDMLGLVDWQLLMLFMALVVVNHALVGSGTLALLQRQLGDAGIDVARPAWLFAVTVALSNLVANVPAVMLLLPSAPPPLGGPILALASTLGGNLILVGSIANPIVVDQAGRLGVAITWRDHARVGVPITLLTLAVAALWLWLRS